MKNNFAFYVIIFVLLTSCKKLVEIPPPKNQLLTEQVFGDSANATSALLGIYINMVPDFSNQITNGGLSIITGLSGDEIFRTSNNTIENEFFSNSISSTNYNNRLLWHNAYNYIFSLNTCIKGIENSNNLNASLKSILLGESKFTRAFIYFNLANLFGDVPKIISTDYNINRTIPRTPTDSLYQFMVEDLLFAKNNLTINYVPHGKFRPNKQTVNTLLSKIYLYMRQWENSENAANEVIESGLYDLEAELNSIFLINSTESIWKLPVNYPTVETWNGYYFNTTVSASSRPNYQITNTLMDAFETDDKRSLDGNWIKKKTVNNVTYNYPYKYKIRNVGDERKEEFVIFRLAELYLIRAEARAEQNKLSGAINDLNIIRNRAGLQSLSMALTSEQVLNAIQQERRIELFCEFGNRWYDLKRWNKASDILSGVKPDWQSTDVLYPIPKTEIERNPFLIQNPGY